MLNQHARKILGLDYHNNQIKSTIIWFYSKNKRRKQKSTD
jgi:hypothetical protein